MRGCVDGLGEELFNERVQKYVGGCVRRYDGIQAHRLKCDGGTFA